MKRKTTIAERVAAQREQVAARGKACGWTIETGREVWFARGDTPEAAVAAAFKARRPQSPGLLTSIHPAGEELTEDNVAYILTVGVLKECGYPVVAESDMPEASPRVH